MRREASVMHLDLDAFFASVEQRDKPSLRGKPVVVGGIGHRGVVATASYEARVFGVRSAMRTVEARARCPHAAFLSGRFEAYRESSKLVMGRLREVSPLVEPLSFDEAFVDLAAGDQQRDLSVAGVTALAQQVRADIAEMTGGLTASVGIASSKLMAKIASELDKPDGLFVVAPGSELEVLLPHAGHRHPRGRSGNGRTPAPHRCADGRGHAAGRARRPGTRRRLGTWSVLAPAVPGHRPSRGRRRAGDEVGERRGHLRDRHHRPCGPCRHRRHG
ncbi:MAG: hypothetical protein WKF83_03985 [Nocardioidaceae bacterium]